MTAYALYTCTTPGLLGLEEVAARIGVRVEDLDPQFGVVPIEPLDDGAWRVAVRIDQRLAPDLRDQDQIDGPFSDPPIEPAGPPQ